MQKKILLIAFLFLMVSSPSVARAHEWKTDGSITVFLHIYPGDDPIVGEPARLMVQIEDKNGTFKPENCACTFTVQIDGTTIADHALFSGVAQESVEVPFTFPKKGIYKVRIAGTPTVTNEFQSFSLTYDVRVARENAYVPNPLPLICCVFGGTLLLGGVVLYYKK